MIDILNDLRVKRLFEIFVKYTFKLFLIVTLKEIILFSNRKTNYKYRSLCSSRLLLIY